MDGQQWATTITSSIGAITVLVAGIGGVIVLVIQQIQRIKRAIRNLQQEADDAHARATRLWEAAAMRGKIAGAMNGVIAPTVPTKTISDMPSRNLSVRPDVKEAFGPLLPELKEIYRRNPRVTSGQWAEALAARWDHWILKHICEPIGMTEGECWAAALVLAAEGEHERP